MKVKDLDIVKTLIQLQLEYLENLKKDLKEDKGHWQLSSRAGFKRMSLEVYKQIMRLK
jgi:hypothetical protein